MKCIKLTGEDHIERVPNADADRKVKGGNFHYVPKHLFKAQEAVAKKEDK